MVARASVVLLCTARLALGPAGAQETPPRIPDLVIPVSTELVRIDVVVTDKGGKPRAGLTERDFVVLEDGQPQPIAQFDAIVADPPTTTTTTSASTASEAEEAGPERGASPRRVVLAVDDVHVEPGSLLRMKKMLDRHLERETGTEDLIALTTTTGNHYHDFTDDRFALRKAIGGLSVQNRALPWTDVPYITEYQAEKIERGDPEALRIAVEEIQNNRLSGDAEAEARSRAKMVYVESVNSARMTLESLNRVVRSLSGLPGRKVVVLFSDGFLAGLTTDGTAAFDIRRITDAGTRAGVVLYALDTRGLVATSAGRSASSRMPMTTGFNIRDNLEREGEHATRDAMSALVADTGGFLVQGGNDFASGLRRILKDTETYYAVAYEPTNTKRDGAFHKIEVRLPGVRDVRIRARKGYFAPDDRRLARAAGPAGAPVSARPAPSRMDAEMRRVLASPELPTALPVRLSADFVNMDGVGPQVVVTSQLDLNAVTFSRENQHRVGTVETAAAVFDESGAMVAVLEAERTAMDLTDASYAQALKDGLQYRKLASVKPGRYQVRLAVREEATGKEGGASQWVQVPDLAEGRLTLSNLFLLKDAESPPGDSASPGEAPSLRSSQASRRYMRGEKLYVQLYAYNSRKDESGATSLVAQAEIWRRGVFLAASAPQEIAPDDRNAPDVEHTRSIKLDPFPPGDYEVRILVTDQNSRQMTSRQAAFVIE